MVNKLKISYKKCNIETEECGSIRQTRNPQRVCWGRSEDDDDDDDDNDDDNDDGDDDDDDNDARRSRCEFFDNASIVMMMTYFGTPPHYLVL